MCQEKFDADLYLKFSKYGSKVLGSGNAPVRGLILSVPDILDLVLFSTPSALIGHVSTLISVHQTLIYGWFLETGQGSSE